MDKQAQEFRHGNQSLVAFLAVWALPQVATTDELTTTNALTSYLIIEL